MNYRSVADLNADLRSLAVREFQDVDLVVGIPRSGLLAGNLLALHLNRPLTDIDGLLESKIFNSGKRYDSEQAFSDINEVIIVDDSVCTGSQMSAVHSRLQRHNFDFNIRYAAAYVSAKGTEYVEHWCDVVETPRVFEWNLFHHGNLSSFCVAFEGVLADIKGEFVAGSDVEPLVLPSKEIGWIISTQPTADREQVEHWLTRHGVEYNTLVFATESKTGTNSETDIYLKSKLRQYTTTDAQLFIEHNYETARELSRRSGKPVFSTERQVMIQPHDLVGRLARSEEHLDEFFDDPIGFTEDVVDYLKGRIKL